MPTYSENRDFVEAIVTSNALECAIDWIKSNLTPGDVFSIDELSQWAYDNGFINEDCMG